jgi:hypothetical protein
MACLGMQAFAATIQQVLREQSAALQHVPMSVRFRRRAELQSCVDLRYHLAWMPQDGIYMPNTGDITVLEAAVHTMGLQVLGNPIHPRPPLLIICHRDMQPWEGVWHS